MKAFILKIFVLTSLVAAILFGIWQCPGAYTSQYAAAINKLDMLKKRTSPKIVLIGGSNILYVKGDVIEKEFPFSVANLGMWYGINYSYYWEEIKPFLKPGDVVLFIIEYCTYSDENTEANNRESEQIIFMSSPAKWFVRYTAELRMLDAIKAFVEVTQQRTKTALQNIRSGHWKKLTQIGLLDYNAIYNDRGEWLIQWPVKRPLPPLPPLFPDRVLDYRGFYNDVNDYCKARNIRVYSSFQPLPIKHFIDNREDIEAIHRNLKTMKIPVLGKPEDFIYPEDNFLNTPNHVNSSGEEKRTATLCRLLARELTQKK